MSDAEILKALAASGNDPVKAAAMMVASAKAPKGLSPAEKKRWEAKRLILKRTAERRVQEAHEQAFEELIEDDGGSGRRIIRPTGRRQRHFDTGEFPDSDEDEFDQTEIQRTYLKRNPEDEEVADLFARRIAEEEEEERRSGMADAGTDEDEDMPIAITSGTCEWEVSETTPEPKLQFRPEDFPPLTWKKWISELGRSRNPRPPVFLQDSARGGHKVVDFFEFHNFNILEGYAGRKDVSGVNHVQYLDKLVGMEFRQRPEGNQTRIKVKRLSANGKKFICEVKTLFGSSLGMRELPLNVKYGVPVLRYEGVTYVPWTEYYDQAKELFDNTMQTIARYLFRSADITYHTRKGEISWYKGEGQHALAISGQTVLFGENAQSITIKTGGVVEDANGKLVEGTINFSLDSWGYPLIKWSKRTLGAQPTRSVKLSAENLLVVRQIVDWALYQQSTSYFTKRATVEIEGTQFPLSYWAYYRHFRNNDSALPLALATEHCTDAQRRDLIAEIRAVADIPGSRATKWIVDRYEQEILNGPNLLQQIAAEKARKEAERQRQAEFVQRLLRWLLQQESSETLVPMPSMFDDPDDEAIIDESLLVV